MCQTFLHFLAALVYGDPRNDVSIVAENSGSQLDDGPESSIPEEFFTTQEIKYVQRLHVENRLITGGYRRSGERKCKSLRNAQKQSPRLLAHLITESAYKKDTLEGAMKHLISLTTHLKISDDEKQAVFDLLHKLFTRDCFIYMRKKSGVLYEQAGEWAIRYDLDNIDTESGLVLEIRKQLEKPMRELYDSYWTPPSSTEPPSSETDSSDW
ncbi:hypothetical protein PAPHI01_1750 [Pancytospora philotis]|nr:hypothetical protein PAPHI01_1537 [Pancytospora philotis]KAI4292279.1 hypothetical protein PAPHI01_1553 [Pancytospora philotis]KAI4292476.1 hypothetical protein PAPHI01_1750 [Pancytospora philotis]